MPKRQRPSMRGIDAIIPAAEQSSTIAPKLQSDKAPESQGAMDQKNVKLSVYLPLELVAALEKIRLDRLLKGERIDRSSLMREAVEMLVAAEAPEQAK